MLSAQNVILQEFFSYMLFGAPYSYAFQYRAKHEYYDKVRGGLKNNI